jgi:DnaJ family protein C protein 13
MNATKLLNRMVNDEKEGPRVMLELRRFMPIVLVNKIKDQVEIVCSQFDTEHETPEIIWTGHMREQLRQSVENLAAEWNEALWEDKEFELPRNYHMEYPELAQELYVGGIYIRLFLQDPKFPLRDPKLSLEGCLNMFFVESKYELDRLQGKEVKRNDDDEKYVDATQPENLKENILSTITSGIACLLKAQPTLAEHVAMLDYPKKLVATLKTAVKLSPRGDLTMSVIRIMHDVCIKYMLDV